MQHSGYLAWGAALALAVAATIPHFSIPRIVRGEHTENISQRKAHHFPYLDSPMQRMTDAADPLEIRIYSRRAQEKKVREEENSGEQRDRFIDLICDALESAGTRLHYQSVDEEKGEISVRYSVDQAEISLKIGIDQDTGTAQDLYFIFQRSERHPTYLTAWGLYLDTAALQKVISEIIESTAAYRTISGGTPDTPEDPFPEAVQAILTPEYWGQFPVGIP